MTTNMNSSSQFKDLNEFLAKHSAKNEQKVGDSISFTHTRIGDKELNIYAGSYIIPNEELQTFYSLYHDSIFNKKRKEYLTERQLDIGGPMAVDFDFRYNHDVSSRQHTREHVSDMVCEYAEVLKECYIIEANKPFNIYIFEKPNVNRLADGSLTKDGIHMLIGMQIDHTMQILIREKMIEKLSEIWDLPLINTWDSVLDEGISRGKTNWQLFGSRKPGNEAYELTHIYSMTIDGSDGQFEMNEEDVSRFDLKNNYAKLSVQYDKNPKFEINPKIIDEYNKRIENKGNKIKKASSKIKMNLIVEDDKEEDDYDDNYLQKFDNDIIKNYVNEFHPECLNHNYDEIAKMSVVVRNSDNIIVDVLHRTIPYLTKYEKARILGQRAKQIETGAKPLVKIPENIVDSYIIAELELREKKIPFIIRRPIPGGGCEYWNLRDLEVIAF